MLTAAVAGSASAVTQGNVFQELIATLPPALQRVIGADITNPVDAFIAIKLLLIMPALLGASAAMSSSAALTRERDRGTVDFLLSLPVTRVRVARERLVAIGLSLSALYLAIWLTLVIVLEAMGLRGSYARYALVLLAGLSINLGQAGLTLALSTRFTDYSRAVRYALGFVLVTYGFEIAFKSAGTLPGFRYLLLYRFSDPIEILTAPWRVLLALLVGVIIAAVALKWTQKSFEQSQLEA